MLNRRRIGLSLIWVAVLVELIVTVAATVVFVGAHGRVYAIDDDALRPGSVPATAIVLGSLVSDGEPGTYVRGRLDTVLDLYHRRIVTRIINSGNGSADAGDEPAVMRAYLEERGVPPHAIVDDAAGMSTEQSCVRARDAFGLRAALLITQDFHTDRAVTLCRAAGVDASAVIASCECPWPTVVRNHVRESLFANPRALLSMLSPSR